MIEPLPRDNEPADGGLAETSSVGDELLRAASRVFFDTLTLNDLLQTIMLKVIESTGATKGFLILVNPRGNLDFRVARNMRREDIEKPGNRISRTLIRKVVKTGESVTTGSAFQDPRFEDMESVQGLLLKSIICVPLKDSHRVLGVVYLENHLTEGVFEIEHVHSVEKVAELASLALGMTKTLEVLKVERDRLAEENRGLREVFHTDYEFGNFVGHSEAMAEVAEAVERITDSKHTVLITGESGTGKEMVARLLHARGPWREKPFVAVNCAAVPGPLFESELFGHVKGAFTGADRNRPGKVESAEGGTLFLDEVGDLPLEMQAKLLRLLQERTYSRVGENRTRDADMRVIAATNKELHKEVAATRFREDLYYRLNQLPLVLPPLRQRRADIEELAVHFLRQEGRRMGGFTPEALEVLGQHRWPGNVRELRNVVMRAVTYTPTDTPIDGDTIRRMLDERSPGSAASEIEFDATLTYREQMELIERRYFEEMMARFPGLSRTELAEQLGMRRRTLFMKLKSLGLTNRT